MDRFIIVRGAGDLASGIIWYLKKAGFNVLCLDIKEPSCIRRGVSFCEAIYDKTKTIDGETCEFLDIDNYDDIDKIKKGLVKIFNENKTALMIDDKGDLINKLKPDVVIDAIIAKKNIGTNISMAPLVIGVGPGFTAKVDCHYAIETMRGHNLSHIYEEGSPIPNTGVPGLISGHADDRVMHSPCEGIFQNKKDIGDIVKKDEVLSIIKECIDHKETGKEVLLKASIDGVLRGILRDGFYAKSGLKCADIDPRLSEVKNSFTISDKARSIAGAVLLCVNMFYNKK